MAFDSCLSSWVHRIDRLVRFMWLMMAMSMSVIVEGGGGLIAN